MVPRTVQMAKVVSDFLGESGVAENGSILAKSYRGWSNLYQSYFLGSVATTLGRPATFQYYVHSWDGLDPQWAQPNKRKFGSGFSAILYPVGDSPTPPPFNSLT